MVRLMYGIPIVYFVIVAATLGPPFVLHPSLHTGLNVGLPLEISAVAFYVAYSLRRQAQPCKPSWLNLAAGGICIAGGVGCLLSEELGGEPGLGIRLTFCGIVLIGVLPVLQWWRERLLARGSPSPSSAS